MARRRTQQGKRGEPPEQTVAQSSRRVFCCDWLLSFLLLMAVAHDGLQYPVQLVASGASAALAPDWAWSPVAAAIPGVQSITEWPYWLFAVGMSFLIVRLVGLRMGNGATWTRYGLLAALSLLAAPSDFMPGLLLIIALTLLSRQREHGASGRTVAAFAIIVAGAVVLCLDFSFVLFTLISCWLAQGPTGQSLRDRLLLPAGAIAICGAAAMWSRGFAAAFARPVTWWTVPEQLLPMNPFAAEGVSQWWPVLLLVACVANAWWQFWTVGRVKLARILPLVVFSLLGLTCRYYVWLSLAGVISVGDCATQRQFSLRGRQFVQCGTGIVALVLLLPQYELGWRFVMTGEWPASVVDPADWTTSGRVLLMQPGSTERWQTTSLRRKYQVLIDDRWDLFGDQYAMYQQLCRDLSEIRNSHYLRSDGTWGGYRQWVDAWNPALLVVPATDLDSLRRLSLSPHWKAMGIDSRRVIFGISAASENKPQIQATATLFAELEWPSPQFDGGLDGIIVATSRHERIAVAQALLALRLPYAALRLTPETGRDCEPLETLSYFELAHRVFRQTRMHSLLDQFRAVERLRSLLSDGRLTELQTLRVALGLEELGELEAAIEFASPLLASSGNRGSPDAPLRAAALITRCRDRMAEVEEVDGPGDPESSIRLALRSGRKAVAQKSLARLKGASLKFFQLLTIAADTASETLYRELISLLNQADFPAELRGEAMFYLASLAIEIGDSPGATQAFTASIQSDPALPLNSISRISLANLNKHSRRPQQ